MMNRPILISVLIFLLVACSPSNRDEQIAHNVVGENAGRAAGPACYIYATDRDTVYLVLASPVGDTITGELRYDFFERDGNIGFIEGQVRGDTLMADYTFLSEGMVSVREVGFLLGKDRVIEGYGDVEQVDGRMVFWHKDSLDFSNGLMMSQISCDQLNRRDYSEFFPDSIIHQRNANRR